MQPRIDAAEGHVAQLRAYVEANIALVGEHPAVDPPGPTELARMGRELADLYVRATAPDPEGDRT